ncbi:NAD(P)/FAD-dependent oxidoreductase [Arachidicoccus ginsenosidivorans]|uniref:NADH:ubiquinone reductase (non-electrogenic) n=1 Tax=Arachidicoccus ginsenosidivorans TaxID=496057 RepID=A0A5B8VIG2_9BACT|nr:NAD(P)/FAD-dependent oxidoreductase [Arachidicoccus ginsenosidivorans]QEC70722.1 NAD(P)/FAD-dependent oxidoreductase [Arachidicoccus ginsenosidivorans]
MEANKKQLIIIGGGFAGINLARKLYNNQYYEVTVIDKHNYNYFTPLLYQVATGFLEPSAISYPFRKLFQHTGIHFRLAELNRVDPDKQLLFLSDNSILKYDILAFAAGSTTNFFGNALLQKNALYIKSIEDAINMRNTLLDVMERASVEKDPVIRKALLTMVVAGGGPTGVELAGMLAEFKACLMGMDYPELKGETLQLYMIEGSANLLAPMSDASHKEAFKTLNRLKIDIRLNTRVEKYEANLVYLSTGEVIHAGTLIWAVGVTARIFPGIDQDCLDKSHRMITDAYNRVIGYQQIYAIGDISVQYGDTRYPSGHPQLAQPAIQQGKRLAKNLLLAAKGKPMHPFHYFDRGDMAIIGRSWAVADLFRHKKHPVHLGGILGLLSWLFIHLVSLVNYNNKIKTFYNWLVAYLTHDQVLRMIFHADKPTSQKTPRPHPHSLLPDQPAAPKKVANGKQRVLF